MAGKKDQITNTEKIFRALNRLKAEWKQALDNAIPRRPNEKVIFQTALGLVITELERGPSAYVPRPEPGQNLQIYNAPSFQKMLNSVGSATERIRNQAASEGVPLSLIEKSMKEELNIRQKEFEPLYEKFQMDENKRNIERQTRTYELFYQLALEAIKRFRSYIQQIFEPADDKESHWHNIRTQKVIQVIWQRKSVPFVRKRKTKKPESKAKDYHCNAWNHKPSCTCGWGPGAKKDSKTETNPANKNEGKEGDNKTTVNKKMWIPAIYIYPVKPPPLIMV